MEDCFKDKLISEEEFIKFVQLYRSARFLSAQYVKAMRKPENSSKWKVS